MWENKISILVLVTILALSTISIITLYKAEGSNGATLYVGGRGLENYTLIQSAINAASNGDTVFVYKGIYHENLIINKSIYLIGENKSITIIDGNKSANIVT
jgi:pectin methylesterase-like acyl-CoA thioesterase